MATALVVFACSKKEEDTPVKDNVVPVEVEETGRIVTLTASVDEPDTKVAIVDHKYNWQASDVIGVFQSNGSEDPIEFSTTESGASASFTASTSATLGNYAVYPYASSQASDYELIEDSGDYLMTMILPGSYDYQENALNIPMLGIVSGSNVTFKAIGGVIRFTVTNIPANAATFSFKATNKKIAGAFDFEASAATPQLDMVNGLSGKEVSVDFTPNSGTSHIFSIPVPVGTIDGFTMTVYDNNADEIYSVTSSANIAVERNAVITAPTLTLPDAEEEVSLSYYEKATSVSSGDFLIVWENGASSTAFNGRDVANGYVAASISDGKIAQSSALDACLVEIASMTGGYSIKIKSGTNANKYISYPGSNGITFGNDASANEISIAGGVATIKSGSGYFKYNSASNQLRFRYYGSGQQSVALYKKISKEGTKLNAPTGLKVTAATKTVSWKPVYHATSYDVTVNGSTNNVTSTSYVFTGEDGYYDVSVVAKSTDPTKFDSDAAELSNQKFGNPALAAPTSFVTGTVTDNSIQVSWTGDAHATKYHCTISPADADAQEPTTASVTFTGLNKGTDYVVTVYAIDETGAYANSDPASTSAIRAEEPSGASPVAGVCYNITSYSNIPTGWTASGDVETGNYFKLSPGDYMISPMYNITGCSSATASISIRNYGTGSGEAVGTIYVSYDGGDTWAESNNLTTTGSYATLSIDLSKTFTKQVVIKFANTAASGYKAMRVQSLSFTVTTE